MLIIEMDYHIQQGWSGDCSGVIMDNDDKW